MRPEERPFAPHIAAHVLYQFGDGMGYPAGSFIRDLIQLMTRADSTNLARLTNAFPDYGMAVRLAEVALGVGVALGVAVVRYLPPECRSSRASRSLRATPTSSAILAGHAKIRLLLLSLNPGHPSSFLLGIQPPAKEPILRHVLI
jgi:hypothetical protein